MLGTISNFIKGTIFTGVVAKTIATTTIIGGAVAAIVVPIANRNKSFEQKRLELNSQKEEFANENSEQPTLRSVFYKKYNILNPRNNLGWDSVINIYQKQGIALNIDSLKKDCQKIFNTPLSEVKYLEEKELFVKTYCSNLQKSKDKFENKKIEYIYSESKIKETLWKANGDSLFWKEVDKYPGNTNLAKLKNYCQDFPLKPTTNDDTLTNEERQFLMYCMSKSTYWPIKI